MPTLDRNREKSLHRLVNERIRELADQDGFAGEPRIAFLCECGGDTCSSPVELSKVSFDSLGDGTMLLAVEHADGAKGQRVLDRGNGFVIVARDS